MLWTEEGHRLSWRMMLRSNRAKNTFYIKKEKTKSKQRVHLKDYLTPKQIRSMSAKPDMIWQFAQHLKKTYSNEGKNIEVYVNNKVSVNGSKRKPIISPKTNLAAVTWNYWGHNNWILIDEK